MLCFWTAIAGLNLGASFAEPLPESDMIPWAIGLPPCAPPTPTARSESWTSTPPARSAASTRPKTYSATEPIVSGGVDQRAVAGAEAQSDAVDREARRERERARARPAR